LRFLASLSDFVSVLVVWVSFLAVLVFLAALVFLVVLVLLAVFWGSSSFSSSSTGAAGAFAGALTGGGGGGAVWARSTGGGSSCGGRTPTAKSRPTIRPASPMTEPAKIAAILRPPPERLTGTGKSTLPPKAAGAKSLGSPLRSTFFLFFSVAS